MERGILFSAPMVRAILDGRKTVTRRVVHAKLGEDAFRAGLLAEEPADLAREWREQNGQWFGLDGYRTAAHTAPYALAGDRLWVREAWRLAPKVGIEYRAGGDARLVPAGVRGDEIERWLEHRGYVYVDGHGFRCIDEKREQRWNPAIHMPRWASRLTLDVVDVRVERLHDITDDDAGREGVGAGFVAVATPPRVAAFRQLWNDINGAGSWDANPWVWRIEFTRVRP